MQAINIAAYQRLKDSYAGDITQPSDECYETLEGISDSEEGYQTAAESEADVEAVSLYQELHGKNHKWGPESEYLHPDEVSTGTEYPPEATYPNGYQTAGPGQVGNGQVHEGPASYNSTTHSSYHSDNPNNKGYFRLEGFSDFCGNLESLKVSQIGNGYQEVNSIIHPGKLGTEKQKLWQDPTKIEAEDDFEVTTSCYLCSFRGLLKMCQIIFCVVALSFALTSRFWIQSAVGAWFIAANVSCAVLAACVLVAQTYGEMDRCCFCSRKLIQVLYLLLIPMLLSAGLLAASMASSLRTQPQSDKSMVMVSSMFTLIALFAVITDVVMHRRMWNMFQMAGGHAYIHAAFLA